ncbi:MAG: hypothetical protein IT264_01200 [Saprospiraceae bacterium]|nr:hypothetical protein [Saprospiraceae bacterium]
MKKFFNLFLVTIMFYLSSGNAYTQIKPKDDSKWPDIALQNLSIKYNLQSQNGNNRTYNVVVSLEVINFGEKQTPANSLNLKLSLGVLGPNDSHDYFRNGKTFNKVNAINALKQNQKQAILWKFSYTAVGEVICYDFMGSVANKIPLELVVNNNKLVNSIQCAHPH